MLFIVHLVKYKAGIEPFRSSDFHRMISLTNDSIQALVTMRAPMKIFCRCPYLDCNRPIASSVSQSESFIAWTPSSSETSKGMSSIKLST